MLNILYLVCRGDLGGGGENYLIILLRHLNREKFRPVVIVPKEGPLTSVLNGLVAKVYTVPVVTDAWLANDKNWYSFMQGFPERVASVLKIIHDEKIDLVHTNTNFVFEGAVAAKTANIPHIWHLHIEYQPEIPVFQRFPLQHSSYTSLIGELSEIVITVSNGVKSTLYTYIPEEKIQVLYNGVELARLDNAVSGSNSNLRQELGIADEVPIVCAVGRICKDKAFDCYIDAAALTLKEKPETHFILVGPDDEKTLADSLKKQVEGLGIGNNFHFLGYRADVPEILTKSEILTLTSVVEGFGYVCAEAMACGKPVVATSCVGVTEVVVHEETGFLVDVGDTQGIADNIIKLLSNDKLRFEMGRKGRQRVEKLFDSKKHAEKIEALYTEVCVQRGPYDYNYPSELFVNMLGEIGAVGVTVNEQEWRIKQLEHFVEQFKNNTLYRGVRNIYRRLDELRSKKSNEG